MVADVSSLKIVPRYAEIDQQGVVEVVPSLVEVEVAVPCSKPAVW